MMLLGTLTAATGFAGVPHAGRVLTGDATVCVHPPDGGGPVCTPNTTAPPPIIETPRGPILGSGSATTAVVNLVTAQVSKSAASGSKVLAAGQGVGGRCSVLPCGLSASGSYCNADSCSGVSMPNPPWSFGWNCGPGASGHLQGGGSAQFYYPDNTPDNYALVLVSGENEASGCGNNQEVCILTVSFETKGARTQDFGNANPLGTIPGTTTGTVNYSVNAGYSYTTGGGTFGGNASVGGSYNVTQGQTEGKLYNDGQGGSTGYVAAWEYTNGNCTHSAEVTRGSSWWTYPFSDDSAEAYNVYAQAAAWYNSNASQG